MYDLLRNLMFRMDAEKAHVFGLHNLARMHKLGLTKLVNPLQYTKPVDVMGLTFPNPIGLAAGLDKDGTCIDAFGALGFGFVEIGTVTPKPQPGNDKPRLFRLKEHQAIINRMGFNNEGVDALVARAEKRTFPGVLGINIGKNKVTPNEAALDDYLYCLRKVYPVADYVAVNISSPNTPGLRDLQAGEELVELLTSLKQEQGLLESEHGKYVPIALKIAPDLEPSAVKEIAEILADSGLDGIIATNTTIERAAVEGHALAGETGGLSGAPVRDASTEVIRVLAETLQGRLPIIGVGGVLDGADAKEKLEAGASLVQVYSGFIYRGPALLHDIAKAIG